jgi:hypothetical protein
MIAIAAVSACIALLGVLLSVLAAVFVSGTRIGSMMSKMDQMAQRLAKIEGMFELRLRKDDS